MNNLWNLIRKELRELLTPSSLASVVVMMVVFIVLGNVLGGQIQEESKVQPFGYVDLTDGTGTSYSSIGMEGVSALYKEPDKYVLNLSAEITSETDTGTIKDVMTKHDISTLIVFTSTYNSNIQNTIASSEPTTYKQAVIDVFYLQNDTSVFSAVSTATASSIVSVINSTVRDYILVNNYSVDSGKLPYITASTATSSATFLNGTLHTGVTPDQIYATLSKQTMFVPLIIMLIIVMIGNIVISSMGNEKENKTLETLLTLPVNRTTIVSGKLIGSTIAGLVMGLLYMVGMYFYINGLTSTASSGGVSMDSLGLTLNIFDWIVIVAVMFLAIVCALGLCMILGAFAKNYKAAQTYIMPISVLALVPMFVTMFSSFDSLPLVAQILVFAIPFSHPMMIMQELMFGNYTMVVGGIVYLIIFAALTIYITVRLYKSDILLTGIPKKKNGLSKYLNLPGKKNDEQ
jgi:ABC-2 type transport system permease protein